MNHDDLAAAEEALQEALEVLWSVGRADIEAHWRVGEILDPLEDYYKTKHSWREFLEKKGLLSRPRSVALLSTVVVPYAPLWRIWDSSSI